MDLDPEEYAQLEALIRGLGSQETGGSERPAPAEARSAAAALNG